MSQTRRKRHSSSPPQPSPVLYVSKVCPHSREILIKMRDNQKFADKVDIVYVEDLYHIPTEVDRVPMLLFGEESLADEKLFEAVSAASSNRDSNTRDVTNEIESATGIFDNFKTEYGCLDGERDGRISNTWSLHETYDGIQTPDAEPMPMKKGAGE